MSVVDSELKTDIVLNRRNYFAKEVNPILRMAVNMYGKKYPEPTKENCANPDSWVLLDIWDEFFELEDNLGRDSFFKALRKITVGVLEPMDYYSERMTWFLMKLMMAYLDGRWQPLLPCTPFAHWKDPATIAAKDEAIEDFLSKQAKTLTTER